MKTSVVIGANYGDEGKGLVTDYLCHKYNPDYVVRFNGGAQAGHTVKTPHGQQHVFSHFGAGTFAGTPTYLSSDFVINPILFFKERAKIETDIDTLYVSPLAHLSTPYDMIINQELERHRSKSAHGSCGVGFGETIERNERRISDFCTTGLDLVGYNDNFKLKLQAIRKKWVPFRLAELGIPYFDSIKNLVMNDNLLFRFLEDSKNFMNFVNFKHHESLSKNLVFEGAQGLGLDQDYGYFPHVTRSNTGLRNVVSICRDVKKIKEVDVYYVTRAYLTRHGNGPFEREYFEKPYSGINETTNVTNEFQGSFRYGILDVNNLRTRIRTDLNCNAIKVNPKLVVTCIDQIDDVSEYYLDGKIKQVRKEDFAITLARDLGGIATVFQSNGPTRNTISEHYVI